jgi:hypothetical protein
MDSESRRHKALIRAGSQDINAMARNLVIATYVNEDIEEILSRGGAQQR